MTFKLGQFKEMMFSICHLFPFFVSLNEQKPIDGSLVISKRAGVWSGRSTELNIIIIITIITTIIIIIIIITRPARPSGHLTSRLWRSAWKWGKIIFRDTQTLHHSIYIIIIKLQSVLQVFQ